MISVRAWAVAAVALFAAFAAPQIEAQRLGRLFTTPEQRAALDDLRDQAQLEQPAPEQEPASATSGSVQVTEQVSGPTMSNLTINGVVRHRGGRTTVWVNGDEVRRGNVSREGVLVESAARRGDVRLRLPSGTESVALRPGQKIDFSTGTVLEAYERVPTQDRQSAFPSDRTKRRVDDANSAASAAAAKPSLASGATSESAAGESRAARLSSDVMEKIEALTKAARAAAGLDAAPARQ